MTKYYLAFAMLCFVFASCETDKADSGLSVTEQMARIRELVDSNCVSFIHLSDIHSSDVSIREAVTALTTSNVDFALITGDLLAGDALLSDIAASPKPVFLVPGNHDIYEEYGHQGFRRNVANRIMDADVIYGNENGNYFFFDYRKNHKVLRIIGLDQFDTERYEYEDYVVYSQSQIDWLCHTLKNSEDVDGIIILIHEGFGNAKKGSRDITNKGKFISSLSSGFEKSYDFYGDCDPLLVPDIVEAYQTGRNIEDKHYFGGIESIVSVTTDFQGPSDKFIAYFGGHLHWDEIEYLRNYRQLQCLMAFCGEGTGSKWNDLIKKGDGNPYNFNVNCYNFKSELLSVYRVGAQTTINNTIRDSVSFAINK